jgi:putative membrane protein
MARRALDPDSLTERTRRIVYRFLVNALGLIVAAAVVDGVALNGWRGVAIAAAVFGLVNAFIKPVVKALTCPFYVLTLGLFAFVVNALMIGITAWIVKNTVGGFTVDGFAAALSAAVIVTIVSFTASVVF